MSAGSVCLDEQTMLDFLAGSLGRDARSKALGHIDGCEDCRAVLASLASQRRRSSAPATTPVPSLFQPTQALPQLGRYRLEQKLPAGGMGEVYLATQLGPGGFERPCVVKMPYEGDPELVKLFFAEAKALASVEHPNVARVLELGEEDDRPFLAMELIVGKSLKEVIAEYRRERLVVPLPAALEVVRQAALGLGAAHAAVDRRGESLELIHRDVSPNNLMLARDGVVKVIDFGLARSKHGEKTEAGVVKGTPRYFSPEQAKGAPLDARTDIFSLGLVLYELLTSERAYDDESAPALVMRAARGDVPRDRPDHVPPRVWKLLARCTELEPRRRFPSMAALLDALDEVAGPGGPAAAAALAARSAKAMVEGQETQPVAALSSRTRR
ncbi:MAG: serine/threonine protein kinase [Myxococcaceae bacterium]|nr:serine/threonine protein kinase [Myxococcaceae bacterium]